MCIIISLCKFALLLWIERRFFLYTNEDSVFGVGFADIKMRAEVGEIIAERNNRFWDGINAHVFYNKGKEVELSIYKGLIIMHKALRKE